MVSSLHIIAMSGLALSTAIPGVLGAQPLDAARNVIHRVDDSELSAVRGRYLGSNMLVGIRVDLVSRWQDPAGNTLGANASLLMQRDANGQVSLLVGTGAQAQAGTSAPVVNPLLSASGADAIQVAGVSQVSQVAGDGNTGLNLLSMETIPVLSQAGVGANPAASSMATAGPLEARVSFAPGQGLQMSLAGPQGTLTQGVGGDVRGVSQRIGIAGDGQQARNTMVIQMQTAPVTSAMQAQAGTGAALDAMLGLRH